MKKKQGLFSDILNIIILASLSYICACTESSYTLVVLISAAVAAAIFAMVSEKKAAVYFAFGCVCFLVAFFTDKNDFQVENWLKALLLTLDLFLPAAAVSFGFRQKNATALSTAAYATVANIFVLLMSLAKIKFYNNVDIHAQLESIFTDMINQYSDLIASNTALVGIGSLAVTQALAAAKQVLIMMMPSLLIFSSMACAYFVTVVARSLISVYSHTKMPDFAYFSDFHIDNNLCKISIALIIIVLFSENLYLSAGIYNFLALAIALYFVDGLAIVDYLAYSKTGNRPLALLITVAVAVAAFTTIATLPLFNGMTILFLLGVLDSGRNFRKIMKVRWNNEQK